MVLVSFVFRRWSMRNAFVSNIYEKTIVVRFINIEEHYLISNPFHINEVQQTALKVRQENKKANC